MLGQAPAMQELFRAIGRLSQSHVTVLITGESGTGKELVAKALHKHSPRAEGPFVAINTAAIPKDLLESELFGHERGAFTGAQAMRRGRFEQADGGTLFLDEIGDMPFDLQTRLLRVLSEGSFYRVGGHSAIKVQVRVIAATHQDLEQRVAQGHFREDLYHRLNVIRLRIPALRERLDDVPVLIRHFLQASATQLGVEAKRLAPAAMWVLSGFHFPGNVRQLENLCHWLTVMAPGQVVDVKDLPPEVRDQSRIASLAFAGDADTGVMAGGPAIVNPTVNAERSLPPVGAPWTDLVQAEAAALLRDDQPNVWDQLTQKFESALITAAIAHTKGRRVDAANKLGIGRNTITRKIQDLGLYESLRDLR
jgi:two-component system nitrogen regulation response regulator GlnG